MADNGVNLDRSWRRQRSHALTLVASVGGIYGLWFLFVTPNGEFPLNDDWAYAWSVRHLLQTGELRLSEWSSATSLFPIAWGALFSSLHGVFSFAALRWSTLVVSMAGCIALYDLLRQCELPFRSAWIGVLVLAVNPIYVYLSYTFMSDVFFFTPFMASVAFYYRGVARRSSSALFVGSLFAALAYLARQLGVALPLAAALTVLLRDRKLDWRAMAVLGAVPFVVFAIHTRWLIFTHGLPWGFELVAIDNSWASLLQPTKPFDLVWRLFVAFLYLGVFTLPLQLAVLPGLLKDRAGVQEVLPWVGKWFVGLVAFVALTVFVTNRPMPYLTNVINLTGIGPLTLVGTKSPTTPIWVFWLLTAVAPFAAAVQGGVWTHALLRLRRQGPAMVLLIASLVMAAMTAAVVTLWDEYLLVFIPASMYLTLRLRPITTSGTALAIGGCVVMFVYGERELADHMSWNAAKWAVGRQLMAEGVPPSRIDAGFEWAGWYDFESALPVAIEKGKGREIFGWRGLTPAWYRLAFSPVEGHEILTAVPYAGPASGRVYVLKPIPRKTADPEP